MESVLVVPEELWTRLRAQMAGRDGLERMAFGLLGVSRSDHRNDLLLRELHLPTDLDYEHQGPGGVSLGSRRAAALLDWARRVPGFLHAHNHPGAAFLSGVDLLHFDRQLGAIFNFLGDGYCLRLVSGIGGVVAEVGTRNGGWEPLAAIKVVRNAGGIDWVFPLNSPVGRERFLPAVNEARHDRTLRAFGERGHQALQVLAGLRVGLIGVGGLGSAVLQQLAFLGVRHWVLADPDLLEESNANRWVGFLPEERGEPKVRAARRMLLRYDPGMDVEPVQAPVPEAFDALKTCDVLLSSPDNDWARALATEFAARHLKPLVDMAAGMRCVGDGVVSGSLVRVQLPTLEGACLFCTGLPAGVSPPDQLEHEIAIGYVEQSRLPTPASVVTINTVAASLATRALLGWLLGEAPPRYLQYDERPPAIRDLSPLFPKIPDCPVCGTDRASLYGWGDRPLAALEAVGGGVE